jgi:hypothetical protein
MKSILLFLVTGCTCFAAALDFTYKGISYENRTPAQQQIYESPAWRYEEGEPPVSVREAHTLAWAWVRQNFGSDFDGTAHSVVLNYQTGPEAHHGFWTVVFTEKAEAKKKIADMKARGRVESFTPAHLYVYVLFDRRVVGPTKKGPNQASEPTAPAAGADLERSAKP